ncbi:phospholipid carrier-dependent glycosyltransferase [Thermanaerothrix sp. 4228-RoL]|uniref:Phospholipid carrier-dependent glycosyltransferase n=2 Tax=Thermanaerothrix TaxID=1077886 RepID=A0ABU3NNW3_9CHLR|nr:phospholipid carrier-dependent glycosyltransferase [Thermanaerothrix sp. 4228-RoL]MDT8898539.1 phospholipid carrier-dependent glycosyltransferase [Thermanaerothrix sp. 4228-RoL]
MKQRAWERNDIFIAALIVLGLIGGWLVVTATPYGMGLVNDSAVYIGGARHLLAGQGYMRLSGDMGLKPITHFPPLFSLALMLTSLITRTDPLQAARLLLPLLFGFNIVLLGFWVRLLSRRNDLGLLAAALWAFSDWGLNLHIYMLSEPLFFTFLLLALITWHLSRRSSQSPWAVLNGLATGLAYLTRYAGAALLATFGLLWIGQAVRDRRWNNLGRWLLGALPLPALWTLYTWQVGETVGNRQIAWHPISLESLRHGLQNSLNAFAPDWLIRLFPPLGSVFSALGLLACVLIIIAASLGLRQLWKASPEVALPPWLAPALFVLIYWLFLIVSVSLWDASIPINDRILSPVYLMFLALGVTGVGRALTSPHQVARRIALVGLILWMPLLVWDGITTAQMLRQEGQGFAHRGVQTTRLWSVLQDLPPQMYIYSDRPAIIHIYARRSCLPLPTPIDPVQDQPRADYAPDLAEMKARIQAGQAVLVLFDLHRSGDPDRLAEATAGLGEPQEVDFVWVWGRINIQESR